MIGLEKDDSGAQLPSSGLRKAPGRGSSDPPRRAVPTNRFIELASRWEKQGARGRSLLRLPSFHFVTGPEFLNELGLLHGMTEDQRFLDVIDALAEYEMMDLQCNWDRNYVPNTGRAKVKYFEDFIFCFVELKVRNGMSVRIACAEFVAGRAWPGHSFEAAVKEIERIWRRCRKTGEPVGQVAARLLSNDRRRNQE
jgi:hypothetical protein